MCLALTFCLSSSAGRELVTEFFRRLGPVLETTLKYVLMPVGYLIQWLVVFLKRFARTDGSTPVSYTHLDVYKRQAQVIVGKSDVIDLLLTAFLSEGHVLIEDVPGVGKTLLAKTFAQCMGRCV